MFAADDLPARRQRQQEPAGRTASTLLQEFRGLGAPRVPPPPRPGAAAVAAEVEAARSEELPVSTSPDHAALESGLPAELQPGEDLHPAAAAAEEAEESPAATPAYRSAALQRLAAIFGGFRGSGAAPSADAGGLAAEPVGNEEAGTPPPGSAAPLSPVRQYIHYRQGRKLARRLQRQATAEAEGREPEPDTPLPSAAAFAGGGQQALHVWGHSLYLQHRGA